MSDKYFVNLSNEWFYTYKDDPNKDKFVSLAKKYGAKSFTLFFKLMQTGTYRGYYIVNNYYISEWFGYEKNRDIQTIFNRLNIFEKDKIIKFQDKYDLSIIHKGNIYYQIKQPQDGYFSIFDYEANRILYEYSGKSDKYRLFLLFACLKSHYNIDTRVCYPTIEIISKETGMIDKTIIEGIDILVDLGLILYDNPGTKLFSDGTIRECGNVYTMNYGGNDQFLRQYIENEKQKIKEFDDRLFVKELSNLKRSNRLKYRHLENKFLNNKISEQEYLLKKDLLEEEYNLLVKQRNEISLQGSAG